MVKHILFATLLFIGSLLGSSLQAQTVTNVTAEQNGTALNIHYSLQTDSPCEVQLFVSLNGGASWTGPLLRVSGDVGKDITAGDHTIRWEVLEEQEQLVGNNIQFKVVANGKKWFEPEMVFVKGGTFSMGSNTGDDDERPVHQVTLSDFSIGKYEVTQDQWKAVMGSNPSDFSGCDDCPVEKVSWNDVQDFLVMLNRMTGKNFRLPTEAEWEYAARGGSQSRNYTYSGSNDLGSVAWYTDNSGWKTHAVGKKQPNELGIYDMSGNVWEWCSDWYGAYNYYSQKNPSGPASGRSLVQRGGSIDCYAIGCLVASRTHSIPSLSSYSMGFRLVLDPVR